MNEQLASAKRSARVELAHEPDFALGNVRVRPSLLEIAGVGWSETLEPRVMQVLVALARAAGEVVSRDDLIEACWEGRIVGDDAINRCMGRLRKLADASDGAFMLETVPRVGFRLKAADVAAAPEAEAIVSSAPDSTTQAGPPSGIRAAWPRRAQKMAAIAAAATVAVVAVGFGLWRFWPRPDQAPIAPQASVATLPSSHAASARPGGVRSGKFEVLHSFSGPPDDGANPWGDLLDSKNGNLYGTTYIGGSSGFGTVFQLDMDGTETVLHAFTGSDGANPVAGLIMDDAGKLYGTTRVGGAYNSGVAFKLGPDGTGYEVLHVFAGPPDDGRNPRPLIMDNKGSLYSTTGHGGTSNEGTVFKLGRGLKETVLYSFAGGRDGQRPLGGVIADKAGNLYGTTDAGGQRDPHDDGIVFKLAPDGTKTILHAFNSAGGKDGAGPWDGLVADKAGALYGTTLEGGAFHLGTVFKLKPDGTEKVLHSFAGGGDGAYPYGGLFMDRQGNLYGTTSGGNGADDYGTIFKLAPDGTETVLHVFTGGSDGASPQSGLIAASLFSVYRSWVPLGLDDRSAQPGLIGDSEEYLYGTTFAGGAHGFGTIFRIKK